MLRRYLPWWGALTVLILTAVLVVLDVSDASVHRYWSRHSFTSSVVSGLLVLLLTVLVVDRVARLRQVRNQSRAIGAQAAIILAQAERTADAISAASSAEDRQDASDQLRTYGQMLLTSTPVLIDAARPRAFLEEAQRAAAQMFRALRESEHAGKDKTKGRLDDVVKRLRKAAAPLVAALNRQQQQAVSVDGDGSQDAESASSASGKTA
jgi:hypothetical protein